MSRRFCSTGSATPRTAKISVFPSKELARSLMSSAMFSGSVSSSAAMIAAMSSVSSISSALVAARSRTNSWAPGLNASGLRKSCIASGAGRRTKAIGTSTTTGSSLCDAVVSVTLPLEPPPPHPPTSSVREKTITGRAPRLRKAQHLMGAKLCRACCARTVPAVQNRANCQDCANVKNARALSLAQKTFRVYRSAQSCVLA